MRICRGVLAATITAALAFAQLQAVTRVPSGDGQFWDIQDTSPWSQDSGGIATGGRANPFNGFGYLKMQVRRADNSLLARNHYLRGFGLHHDGAGRFDSTTPVLVEGIAVSRGITTAKDTHYLRYLDTFTNATSEERLVEVAWGGAAGAFTDGGLVYIAATSSGDRAITGADQFVTVMQNARSVSDPMLGPSGHGPSAHVIGQGHTSVGDMQGDPFAGRWPGGDPAQIAYLFTLRLRPGETRALMTFVVKGLSEVYDPRGGYPLPFKDALVTGEPVYSGADARIPAAGSEIKRVTDLAAQLVKQPDVRGLTPLQRSQIANWEIPPLKPGAIGSEGFTVFEKTVTDLQNAMSKGIVTSEDITREYLTRLSIYDRHGPTFRSVLSINPRAIADARARDAERAAGRALGPLHGVPIVYKDNIDGGSAHDQRPLALVDHRPRLIWGSPRHEAGGPWCSARPTSTSFRSVISASARSAAPWVAYDPRSALGSAGGRRHRGCHQSGAWLRHRHCNSSNPAGFASSPPSAPRAG